MSCAENNDLLSPYYPFIIERCAKLFNKGNSMHLDLANQIYLSVVEIKTTELIRLINEKKIQAYLDIAIRTQRRSNTSTFARLYKRETAPAEVTILTASSGYLTFENLKRLTDFDKTMLALYLTYECNYEAAAKAAHINKGTLISYIKQIKKKLL